MSFVELQSTLDAVRRPFGTRAQTGKERESEQKCGEESMHAPGIPRKVTSVPGTHNGRLRWIEQLTALAGSRRESVPAS